MGWIMKAERATISNEDFRICHHCGQKIYNGEACILTHDSRWIFHPKCGFEYQKKFIEEEEKLNKAILLQLKFFYRQHEYDKKKGIKDEQEKGQ